MLNIYYTLQITDDQINEFIQKCNSQNDETALEKIWFPFVVKRVKRKINLRDQIFLASIYSENNRRKSLNELVKIGAFDFLNLSNDEV